LGSNVGDHHAILQRALEMLDGSADVDLVRVS
jgi:7,8-dihydro-6-hydroxymethylpterin-pyrophosphokinase